MYPVNKTKPGRGNKSKMIVINPNRVKRSTNSNIVEKFSSIQLAPAVNKKPKQKPTGVTNGRVALPKCTLKYALALSDPFSVAARGVCVPVGSSETMKAHAFMRFDVTIGTNGSALIYLTPSIANDMPSVLHTDGAWTGTTYSPIATSGTTGYTSPVTSTFNTGWVGAYHNGPFNAGELAGPAYTSWTGGQGKLVCAALRAQYTGTTLNESGLYYCYHDPAHASLSGVSQSSIGNFGDASVEAVSRMPCTLNTFAINDTEMGMSISETGSGGSEKDKHGITSILYPYSQGNYAWNNQYLVSTTRVGAIIPTSTPLLGVGIGVPIGVIGITGVAGQKIHVEGIFHLEFAGLPAATRLSHNSTDIAGALMVRGAALSIPQAKLA